MRFLLIVFVLGGWSMGIGALLGAMQANEAAHQCLELLR